MRIGCLQFDPQVCDVDNDLSNADSVLKKAQPKNLNLLILPELAFSGRNLILAKDVNRVLEPNTAGTTQRWARTAALKHQCFVTVGYPELAQPKAYTERAKAYNSAIMVNAAGEIEHSYRKVFLCPTDELWASRGSNEFYSKNIRGLGIVFIGISTDLNPDKGAAGISWELAYKILDENADLIILPMAWTAGEHLSSYSGSSTVPDMKTLGRWLKRLDPLIRAKLKREMIVVFANRTGTESGRVYTEKTEEDAVPKVMTEEKTVYAGTSAVIGIQAGEVKLYGMLGLGQIDLLVVDTTKPQAKLVWDPKYGLGKFFNLDCHTSYFPTKKWIVQEPEQTKNRLAPIPRPPSPKSKNASPGQQEMYDLTLRDLTPQYPPESSTSGHQGRSS